MLEFSHVKVYDLEESVIACRNAMRTDMPQYTEEEFKKSLERAKKLVSASSRDKHVKSHDNFLTGIRVSFDMKYEQYITKQFQRYHWFDYVSSSSMMHRITKMDFSQCCNKYVDDLVKSHMKALIESYNDLLIEKDKYADRMTEYKDMLYERFMRIISNCPMGAELFVHVSTNYKQLQTIYYQRQHHKLKEDYQAFFDMVESLPYAKELIICKDEEQ